MSTPHRWLGRAVGLLRTPRRFAVELRRDGLVRRPFYHVVVVRIDDERREVHEKLGLYNPMLPPGHPRRLLVRRDRLSYWLDHVMPLDERTRRVLVPDP